MLQAQSFYQFFDSSILLFNVNLELEPSSEGDHFLDREVREKYIILHDVRRIVFKNVLIERMLVVE